MNIDRLKCFIEPYYSDKDIMHNLWHIELVHKWVDKIIEMGKYNVDYENLIYAMFFHGFIYSHENDIRIWLKTESMPNERIEKIVEISWESQRQEIPKTMEGKILHDAHVLEGGKTYLMVKTLITGSVRGQSLVQTLDFMKKHVIDKNHCYLPETMGLCNEMNEYAKNFIKDIENGIL
ncbi:MAG: hypothetical protein ACRC1P_09300 [Cellulosilyticaceae bacterium]